MPVTLAKFQCTARMLNMSDLCAFHMAQWLVIHDRFCQWSYRVLDLLSKAYLPQQPGTWYDLMGKSANRFFSKDRLCLCLFLSLLVLFDLLVVPVRACTLSSSEHQVSTQCSPDMSQPQKLAFVTTFSLSSAFLKEVSCILYWIRCLLNHPAAACRVGSRPALELVDEIKLDEDSEVRDDESSWCTFCSSCTRETFRTSQDSDWFHWCFHSRQSARWMNLHCLLQRWLDSWFDISYISIYI